MLITTTIEEASLLVGAADLISSLAMLTSNRKPIPSEDHRVLINNAAKKWLKEYAKTKIDSKESIEGSTEKVST